MHVLVHGAGSAAVLRAAEAPGLEQGRGKLAHTGLVVELPAGADGAALHIFARELAGKARVLSILTLGADELFLRHGLQAETLQVEHTAALALAGQQRLASALADLTNSVFFTCSSSSPGQAGVHRLHIRGIGVGSG